MCFAHFAKQLSHVNKLTVAEIDLSSGTVDPRIEQVALTVHVADTVRSPRKRGTVHPDGRGGRGERPYKFTGKSRLCALRVPY